MLYNPNAHKQVTTRKKEYYTYLLSLYTYLKQENKTESVQVDIVQNRILNALIDGELTFDELVEKTNLKSSQLSSELIKLEMFGLIKKGNNNRYIKI